MDKFTEEHSSKKRKKNTPTVMVYDKKTKEIKPMNISDLPSELVDVLTDIEAGKFSNLLKKKDC